MKKLLMLVLLVGVSFSLAACTAPREDFIKLSCPECNVESYHEVLGEP